MDSGFIAIIDSGIGGISVLRELQTLMPHERYLYFGDNKNAPYGNRTISDLRSLTFRNIDYVKSFGIKALVIGCNTLSTNLYKEISEYANVPTFGVYPPIEHALVNGKNVLLIATERTAERFNGVKGLSVLGLKKLASDIEKNMFNLSNVSLLDNLNFVTKTNFVDKKGFYDTVILGCTHYEFIKNQILDHFRPQKLISGNHFTAKTVKKHFETRKSLVNNKQFDVLFIGDFAKINQKFSVSGGQRG